MALYRLPPEDRAKRIVIVARKTDEEIKAISRVEGRSAVEVSRLLIRLGLRAYRQRRSLLCDYIKCSRTDCCGGERPRGLVVPFGPRERP